MHDTHNQRLLFALKQYQHRSWPYDGVIALVEYSQCMRKKDVHYLHQWRYLQTQSLNIADAIVAPAVRQAVDFDRDHYKLIRHAMHNLDKYGIMLHELT